MLATLQSYLYYKKYIIQIDSLMVSFIISLNKAHLIKNFQPQTSIDFSLAFSNSVEWEQGGGESDAPMPRSSILWPSTAGWQNCSLETSKNILGS